MLLHNKKIGALLRCYALEEHLVENAVTLTLASIEKLVSVKVDGLAFISRVEVLIPVDPNYADKDCGQTAGLLRKAIAERGWKGVYVSEIRHGDRFVGVLNYGMAKLLRAGCDYGIVFSKEAEDYCTTEAAEDLIKAAESGALVMGLAITELTDSIMQGRIANTFAMWNLMTFLQVGGFDLRSAMPKTNAPIKSMAEKWDGDKLFHTYANAGVEEIITIIRLIRTFGPYVAPILPRGEGVKIWKAPDPTLDPKGFKSHNDKMSTKYIRQGGFAVSEHTDPEMSFIKGGVMEAYRHPDYIS